MIGNDENNRFKPKRLKAEERYPYKGNRNPSPQEFAKAGYATLAMDDPTSYRFGRREQLARDVEFDPTYTRRY